MKQSPPIKRPNVPRASREYRIWAFGALACLIFALSLSALMAWLSWQENPSEIFYRDGQTHWPFVWDTFWSWFVPSLYQSLLIYSAVRIALLVVGYLRRQIGSTAKGQ